jgi:hypothetical protein
MRAGERVCFALGGAAAALAALLAAGCPAPPARPDAGPAASTTPPPPVEAGPPAAPAPAAEACPELADAGAPPRRVRRPAARPRTGWPLCGAVERCVTPRGEPGFRYTEPPLPGAHCVHPQGCFNPCPAGMAPDFRHGLGDFCERICTRDDACDEGRCRDGLCDSLGDPPCGGPPGVEGCSMPDGRAGFRCERCGPCYPWCKAGLDLSGGTHCVKSCSTSVDCPGGKCIEGACGPVCPSEGCPYPWE